MSLSHLISDFEEGYKSFEDILIAVAWDEGDETAFEGLKFNPTTHFKLLC